MGWMKCVRNLHRFRLTSHNHPYNLQYTRLDMYYRLNRQLTIGRRQTYKVYYHLSNGVLRTQDNTVYRFTSHKEYSLILDTLHHIYLVLS